MSDRFYSINRNAGLNPNQLTLGTSSSGADIEIRTRDGKNLTRLDLQNALKVFAAYFAKNDSLVVP